MTNAKPKHTPGPWRIEQIKKHHLDFYKGSLRFTLYGPTGCIASIRPRSMMPDYESQANARLIAAAPELLNKLDEAYHYLMNYSHLGDERTDRLIEGIKYAIRKARGESN